jgi:hypothetical protein
LAEISLVILALGSFGLHIDGRFIGSNVTAAQEFPAHCPNDRHEQFTDSHDPTTERDSGKLQSSFPFQHRALTKQRQVIAVFLKRSFVGRGDAERFRFKGFSDRYYDLPVCLI